MLARAQLELDKLKAPEQRLMSQLLREPSADVRKELLHAAFEPVEALLVSAGEDEAAQGPQPEVSSLPSPPAPLPS